MSEVIEKIKSLMSERGYEAQVYSKSGDITTSIIFTIHMDKRYQSVPMFSDSHKFSFNCLVDVGNSLKESTFQFSYITSKFYTFHSCECSDITRDLFNTMELNFAIYVQAIDDIDKNVM